jgi:type 1 fimbria pilin
LRFFVRSVLVLLTGLLSVSAHANLSCSVLDANKTLAVSTISVPVNSAAGTTVSTLAPSLFQPACNFPAGGLNDTSATLYVDIKTTAPLAAGFNDVYNTGVAGIGVRYTFNSSTCSASNIVLANGLVTLGCPVSGPLGGSRVPFDINVTATLIVTGAIKAGATNLTTAPAVGITYRTSDGGTGSWVQTPLYSGSAAGIFIQATCSVNQANVVVPLPPANTRDFSSGAGAVAGPRSFSLSFSCSAGAKVSITLTDSVNPANRSNALQLSSESTAKGIGIQIVNSTGSPVSYGQDSALPGNANQWLIGDSPNGLLEVPLTARYISTGTVTAGIVKALATFTMSYQ